jgi:hypothetical protein
MIDIPHKILLGDQIKEDQEGGECGMCVCVCVGGGAGIIVCRVLVRKSVVKRPCGRCRYRWKNHINKCLQEIGCKDKNSITLNA